MNLISSSTFYCDLFADEKKTTLGNLKGVCEHLEEIFTAKLLNY